MSATLRAIALTLALSACVPPSTSDDAPIEVTANQPPVPALSVPDAVRAGEPFTIDASESVDVDGALVGYALLLDDEPQEGAGPDFSLVLPDDAPHVLTLVVTDDGGASARQKTRVTALPPMDAAPPSLTDIVAALVDDDRAQGAELAEGAPVLGGTTLALTITASDAESDVVDLTITTSAGALTLASLDEIGPARTATATLAIPDIDDSITVEATARDAYDHVSTSTRTFTVWSSSTDSDDDGLPDAVDPAPETANGVLVEVHALETFPRDWLGNQLAEDVVSLVEESAPLHTFTLPGGLLSAASPDGTTVGLALDDDMPVLAENFAVVVRGRLMAPAGMPTARVAIGADDVGVFFVEGAPVASADEEYALNFFRTERLPSEVGPLFFGGAPVSYAILVANESGPCAFDVELVFEGPGGSSLNASELGVGSFLLPE